MKTLKLKHLFFVLCAFLSIAACTEKLEEQPVNVGGKIFCVKPAETYCLNVVNYPRKEIDKLFKNLPPVHNSDLPI